MSDPITVVFGGICVAVVSGAVGKYLGGNGKVSDEHCDERQKSCQALIVTKIENVEKKVDALTKAVNNKLLGI